MTKSILKPYTYRKPKSIPANDRVHGLVEVWRDGRALGLLNRTRNGYAVRDLDGKLLELCPNVSRDVAAAELWRRDQSVTILARDVKPGDRVLDDPVLGDFTVRHSMTTGKKAMLTTLAPVVGDPRHYDPETELTIERNAR